MDLEERLDELKSRKRELQDRLGQSKKEFLSLQKEKKRTLENQIRRAQYRITAAERKRRTRQLILIGSVVKKKADQDSRTRLWLLHALDEDLDRPQDRGVVRPGPEEGERESPPRNATPKASSSSAPGMASPPPGNRCLGLHLPRRYLHPASRSRWRSHYRAVKRRPGLDHHRNGCPGAEQRAGHCHQLRAAKVMVLAH